MVVLCRLGHTKVYADPVQKIGLRQRDAPRLEVARHVKHQTVSANLEGSVVKQQSVRVAPVVVQRKLFDQSRDVTLPATFSFVDGNVHSCGGATVHGVQYMGAQAHVNPSKEVKSVYTFGEWHYHRRMESSATALIVQSLTQAIVAHHLAPGAKLAEQKLADQFGVSRTLVRQALLQLSQHQLIRLEPARGAFVAAPSETEAREVFAVRRMLEAEMTRQFVRQVTPAQIRALKAHVVQEKLAVDQGDATGRTELLGDFHVRMAELMGNDVLAQVLGQLISRCALITLMYQSDNAARHSHEEHSEIIKALAAKDEALSVQLMQAHLLHVEENLNLQPTPQRSPKNPLTVATRSTEPELTP